MFILNIYYKTEVKSFLGLNIISEKLIREFLQKV